ncbi:hypothetical protein L228DRAFT_276227, partial [Xylona heveae TC161]
PEIHHSTPDHHHHFLIHQPSSRYSTLFNPSYSLQLTFSFQPRHSQNKPNQMCKGEQQVFAKCNHQRDIIIKHQCSKRAGTDNFCRFFKGDFRVVKIDKPSLCEECFRKEEEKIYEKTDKYKGKVQAVKSKPPKDLNIFDIWGYAYANDKAKNHNGNLEKFYDAQGGRWTGPGIKSYIRGGLDNSNVSEQEMSKTRE